MNRIATILVLLCVTVPAEAQLLRRLFAPRQVCGPEGCYIVQPEYVQAPKPDFVKDPVPPPKEPEKAPLIEDFKLGGVDQKKLNGEVEHHAISGKTVTKIEAHSALFDDDSTKHWLVLSGEGREKVIMDILADPKTAEWSGKTRIVSMPVGHFKAKLFPVGAPGIMFMKPNGEKLYEATEYKGQATLAAIRASLGGDVLPVPPTTNTFWLIVIGGAIFLYLVFKARQEQPK